MKNIAYLRVSKDSQDMDNQRLSILDYAHRHGITINEFIEFSISSRRSPKERGIEDMLNKLNSGDMLLVSELSRLGRSVGQIIILVDQLIKEGVSLITIKENINLIGKQDMQSKVMVTLFGLFAELERDLISERTKAGLAAARAKGKQLGRPKGTYRSRLDGREADIQFYLDKKVSKASIAKIMDISVSALHSFLKTRGLKAA